MRQTDVVVIGAGVLGSFAARALRRYNLSVDVLEAREDACEGITRSNTGIIYNQNSTVAGSLKFELTEKASRTFDRLCSDLDVPFSKCGYLFISYGEKGDSFLKDQYETARSLGDMDIQELTPSEAFVLEPALSRSITRAVYDPNVGTVDPWLLGIAAYENARANGARFHFKQKVIRIERSGDGFTVEAACVSSSGKTEAGARAYRCGAAESKSCTTYRCGAVLNCAGLSADKVRELLMTPSIRIRPRGGDYYILDPKVSGLVNHIISQETEDGKGITLVPTVDGNILAGPTNRHSDVSNGSFPTTEGGLADLSGKCRAIIPSFPFGSVIRNFGALRPNVRWGRYENGEWIREKKNIPGFPILEEDGLFSMIGIKTPGLTCSNELGIYIADKIAAYLSASRLNPDFDPKRRGIPRVHEMKDSDRASLIEKDPAYGEIVCRCKGITKGEVLEAIRRGAVSVDGVRRRVGAGMGRCQGGFCRSLIMNMLAEAGLPQSGGGSKPQNQSSKTLREQNHRAEALYAQHNEIRNISEPQHYDILIIGAGAAGMAAALTCASRGRSVLLVDRGPALGGILTQCIHDGFGLGYFKEDLTGTEYAERFAAKIRLAQTQAFSEVQSEQLSSSGAHSEQLSSSAAKQGSVTTLLKTTVLHLYPDRRAQLTDQSGLFEVSFDHCILATGCRERAIGSLGISGTRPVGVYTAGQMQKMINIDHLDIGRRVVVLGSGDIGQIVARRMAINGKEIVAMIEKEDHLGGMVKNHRRCIEAHSIPVILNSTITEIRGEGHLSSVVVENLKTGERRQIECDTLITAVGLIPERELVDELSLKSCESSCSAGASGTSLPDWLHITGNADFVHEIVDSVTTEAEALAQSL